jgi:hypothetical protein
MALSKRVAHERRSAVGRVVQAVLRPNDAGGNELRKLGDGDDGQQELLEQIRELVAV